VRSALEAPLAEALAELGYGDVESAPPAEPIDLARLLADGPGLEQSADGLASVGADGTVAVRVRGDDFWVALPRTSLPAETVREIWVSLSGDVGDLCSLYWSRAGEGFTEDRCLHVPFHPGPHWRVVRFRVGDHLHWRGTVTRLRIDPFNTRGAVEPGAGRMRWVRFVG
jgi:hypothetical protein